MGQRSVVNLASPWHLATLRLLIVCLVVGWSTVSAETAAAAAQSSPAADEVDDRVTAAGAVLWDPDDGRILWARQPDRSRRMASTTKIMTALLAVEAGTIDDVVTVSASAASADEVPGAATLQLRAGQRVTMRALLTAVMMRSGNDAAAAVAEHVAGSERAFVRAMNRRARQLGLDATRFLDATGLSNSLDHHASPADLARLAQTAMALPEFADLVDQYRADVPGFGNLTSRNLLLDSYDGATGVKTGYTSLAGLCLVASATRDGRTLYTAVLDSDDTFADTAVLLDHGFNDFVRAGAADAEVGVYRTARGEVDLRVADASERTLPVDTQVRVRSALRPSAPGEIVAGTRLGRIELVIDGEVVDTATIEAASPLTPTPPPATPAGAAGAAVEDALRALARSTPTQAALDVGR